MAKQRLEHSLSSLNLSLDSHDLVISYLEKSQALAHVALAEHFVQCDLSIVHN